MSQIRVKNRKSKPRDSRVNCDVKLESGQNRTKTDGTIGRELVVSGSSQTNRLPTLGAAVQSFRNTPQLAPWRVFVPKF